MNAIENQVYKMNAWEGANYRNRTLPQVWKGPTAVMSESTYGGFLPTDYYYNTEAHARHMDWHFIKKEFVPGSQAHWTRIYHTLFPDESQTRRAFWDAVLSFNYVDRWLANSKDRPTDQDMINSEEGFKQFILYFKPEYLVILSKQVVDHLVQRRMLSVEGSIETSRYGTIQLLGHSVKVCGLNHVRYPNSPYKQHDILRQMHHCPLM